MGVMKASHCDYWYQQTDFFTWALFVSFFMQSILFLMQMVNPQMIEEIKREWNTLNDWQHVCGDPFRYDGVRKCIWIVIRSDSSESIFEWYLKPKMSNQNKDMMQNALGKLIWNHADNAVQFCLIVQVQQSPAYGSSHWQVLNWWYHKKKQKPDHNHFRMIRLTYSSILIQWIIRKRFFLLRRNRLICLEQWA